MEIANFSFTHANHKTSSLGRTAWTVVMIAAGLTSACTTMQAPERVQVVHQVVGTSDSTPAPPQKLTEKQQAMQNPPPVPLLPAQPPVAAPPQAAVLGKEPAKVGVILGPGGMKAYAELGVLREMGRQRIPVQAIVGMEWGAVIAGLYASQGQINEAEWKSFKLKENELPTQSFISSRIKPAQISDLQNFFNNTFASSTIEKNRVDFACPAAYNNGDHTIWQTHGSMQEAVSHCLPYPPLYAENGGWMASPFSLDEAAAWLRSRGANVILLINVIGQGELWPSKAASDLPIETVLWSELRRDLARAAAQGGTRSINHVISVNTTGHPMTDFEGRRALMEAGQKAAAEPLNKMVSEYGF